MIEFNFVYSKNSLSIRKFLKESEVEDYISYQDTFNKLTKNDFYSEEPCDVVVNSFLVKELKKELTSAREVLYYVIGDLDPETVSNIKHFVEEYRKHATYNLYLVNDDGPVPDACCFDSIFFVENAAD
jgi:hypothetical protein